MSVKLDHIAPQLIKPRINEWNVHSKKQFELACRSYERFDIAQPPLIDTDNRIVCGWLMVQVAVAKGLNRIPVIRADHLSNEELRLYAVEAQSLAELAEYDNPLLSIELQQIRDLLGASALQVLPFEQTRLDHLLNLTGNVSLTEDDTPEPDYEAPPISSVGEQWTLGPHRMMCDDAMLAESFNSLMNGERASFTLTDGPYDLPASSISGRGRHKHRDFVQAAGEMFPAEFTLLHDYDAARQQSLRAG